MRNPTSKFDYLNAALNVAARVGNCLSMLGREKLGERIELSLDQFEKFKHDAGTALRIGCRPAWLSRLRIRDGMLDLGVFGERDLGLDFTGIGIKHIAKTPRATCNRLATYEMADLTHGSHSSDYFAVLDTDLGHLAPFCADFRSFSEAGHALEALCGRFFFHQRLAFTPS
jgi:hypothetical protein